MTNINKPKIRIADSAAIDSGGLLRSSSPFTVFSSKNVGDIDDEEWDTQIYGMILTVTSVVGTFQLGEVVTGGTSGATATLTLVSVDLNADNTDEIADFIDGETITGGTSGATATITVSSLGSDLVYQQSKSLVELRVGILSNSRVLRQTRRYHPYTGKPVTIKLTSVFGAPKAGMETSCGYYDDNNGLFFRQDINNISVVVRSSVSGSVVDDPINQQDWNIDKYDGTGVSGLTFDPTTNTMFWIDFLWQSAGRVRFGFFENGVVNYVHEYNKGVELDVPYTATPSLPTRFEIENTGVTASTTVMSLVYADVVHEGGMQIQGKAFAASNGVETRAVTVRTPILAVRLKNLFNGVANRRTMKLIQKDLYSTANDTFFEIARLTNPTGITATWSSVNPNSAVEFSTDITAITGNPESIFDPGYITAAQGNKARSFESDFNIVNSHLFASQNIDSDNSQVFVVYADALTGASSVAAALSWIEFD